MAKVVTITLDPDTLMISVDNRGFQGKGCSAITEEFAKGNTVLKDTKKPEYKQEQKNQVCQ